MFYYYTNRRKHVNYKCFIWTSVSYKFAEWRFLIRLIGLPMN